MKANPVGWFEIYVDDMNRAKAFYENVFKAKLEKMPTSDMEGFELLSFPMERETWGSAGALVKMEGGPNGGSNSVIVYFTCDDCAIEAARVPQFGGRIVKAKSSIGQYGYIALASDTEGNVFGLHSMQ